MTITITLSRPPAAATFEVGSFSEAVGILSDNESALVNLFRIADGLSGAGEGEPEALEAGGTDAAPAPARRGRKPKVEAVAPPPLPVPGTAAPTPPNLAIPADGGIPPFLQRDAAPAAAPHAPTPPPPPLLPAAPPVAPAAPNAPGKLAVAVVAEMEKRAKGSPDGGAALAAWLASPGFGLLKAGATYSDAVSVVSLATDAQLVSVAGLLNVA